MKVTQYIRLATFATTFVAVLGCTKVARMPENRTQTTFMMAGSSAPILSDFVVKKYTPLSNSEQKFAEDLHDLITKVKKSHYANITVYEVKDRFGRTDTRTRPLIESHEVPRSVERFRSKLRALRTTDLYRKNAEYLLDQLIWLDEQQNIIDNPRLPRSMPDFSLISTRDLHTRWSEELAVSLLKYAKSGNNGGLCYPKPPEWWYEH